MNEKKVVGIADSYERKVAGIADSFERKGAGIADSYERKGDCLNSNQTLKYDEHCELHDIDMRLFKCLKKVRLSESD